METATINTTKVNTSFDIINNAKNRLRQLLEQRPEAITKLKQLNNNPDLLYGFSTQDRQDFFLIKRLLPEYFEDKLAEVKEPLTEKMTALPLEKTPSNTLQKEHKASLAGPKFLKFKTKQTLHICDVR